LESLPAAGRDLREVKEASKIEDRDEKRGLEKKAL